MKEILGKIIKLYHASSLTNIEEFAPRAIQVRDINEGPVVFATTDKAYASCFITKTNDKWVQISSWGKKNPWVFICSDEPKFKELDKGGAIYELDPTTFYTDPHKGTGEYEWVSRTSVKPLNKHLYSSGLNAMLENGVQIFFVNTVEFNRIVESDDNGLSILLDLQKLKRSENQKRDFNVKPIIKN
jgi:hypothetical protein